MPPLSTRSRLMVLGRLGLAVGCFTSPDLVAAVLGFPDRSPTTRAFARMIGVRDLAVALLLLATASDPAVHRRALQIACLVDVGDVLSVSVGAIRDPAMRDAALRNLAFAGSSAAFSLLAARSVAGGPGGPAYSRASSRSGRTSSGMSSGRHGRSFTTNEPR